jgi:anti-sigma factor NepR-like protein
MMHDQGKRLAKVYPEPAVQELGAEPTLDREIQARIGDNLRAMYDELLEQPVPDRFAALLERLGQRGEE